MKKLSLIIILFVAACSSKVFGQASVTGSPDCVTAPTVCGNSNLNFVSSSGSGSFVDYTTSTTISNPQNSPVGIVPPGGFGCHLAGELNPNMIIITCQSAGTLEFDIASGPSVQKGCYDWVLWPYSATACSGISGNTLPPTRCCWNSNCSGGTGVASAANLPAGAQQNDFAAPINVQCGDKFLLCISNYSGVNATVPVKFIGTCIVSCAPAGTPLAINSSTICSGSSATLIVSGGTGTATFTPGPIVTNTAVVTPLATTIYTVNKPGGCGTGTITTTVTVLSPTANASNTSPACEGTSFTLNGNASAGATYSWTGPAAYSSNIQSPTLSSVLPSASGTYTLTASLSSGTLNCSAVATTTALVIPVNPVNVNPSVISICEPNPFTLSANANGASSYQWSGPGSYNSGQQNPTVNNTAPGMTGIYTVTASFIGGPVVCQSTNTVDVTVKPLLPVAFPQQANVCGNGTISVPGPAGATSYTWNGPNSYSSNTQNLFISPATSNMSGNYSLIVDANGCITSGNVNINVLTPISFVSVSPAKMICQGDTTNLYSTVTGGSGTYVFSWSPGSGLSNPNAAATIASPGVTTQYTISAADVGCPSQAINTFVTVSVNPKPVPNIVASQIAGCVPLCINLNSNSNPQAASVGWNFGQGMTASGDIIDQCFKNAGTYPITTTITDINGCTSITTANFVITAYPRPQPWFTWNPTEISVIENTGTFLSTSVSGSVATYYWDFGDGLGNPENNSSTAANPSHEFSGAGTFPVTLVMTNAWGCTDTIIRAVDVIEDFTIYIPNAFSPNGDGLNEIFQPKGMGWKPNMYEFLIYDRWGNLLFKTNDYTKGWDGTIKGQLCPTDVYVWRIRVEGSAKGKLKELAGHVTLMK
jgi:gliding motility-associated-like protein